MNKNILNIFLITIMIIFASVLNVEAASKLTKIDLLINNEVPEGIKNGAYEAYVTDGRTIVPVRLISEYLGYEVNWNEPNQEISIKNKDKQVILNVGKSSALVNGKAKNLPNNVTPEIIKARTYVPLRFVVDEFGLELDYDVVSGRVSLKTNKTDAVLDEIFSEKVNLPNERIEITSSGENIEIKKSPFLKTKIFTLSQPERIVVDIYEATLDEKVKTKELITDDFIDISSAYHKEENKTRIVFKTSRNANQYNTSNNSETIYIEKISKNEEIKKDEKDEKEKDEKDKNKDKENELPPATIFDPFGKKLIVLDAGHGGKDSGAANKEFNVKEKDLNLIISEKLKLELEKRGYTVVTTRNKDVFIELADRPKVSNELNASMFVSIHFNAHDKSNVKGIETLYKDVLDNKKYAKIIQEELIKITKATDRGIVLRENLAVLNRSEVPAVLLELGFISNTDELNMINQDSYKDLLVIGVANGIDKIFENN